MVSAPYPIAWLPEVHALEVGIRLFGGLYLVAVVQLLRIRGIGEVMSSNHVLLPYRGIGIVNDAHGVFAAGLHFVARTPAMSNSTWPGGSGTPVRA